MNAYSRAQIGNARLVADAAYDEAAQMGGPGPGLGDVWIDTFTEHLGLTVEDEKPAPGKWHLTRTEGWPAYLDDDGDLCVIRPSGERGLYWADASDWPDLVPAHLVSEDEWASMAKRLSESEMNLRDTINDRNEWQKIAEEKGHEAVSLRLELADTRVALDNAKAGVLLPPVQPNPAKPVELTEDARTAGSVALRDWMDANSVTAKGATPSMLAQIAVDAALATYGHAAPAELPGRDEVQRVVDTYLGPSWDITGPRITEGIMALLPGGDR